MSPLKSSSLQPPALTGYRGRIAPTPTGLLHLGHGRTFWTAYQRARDARGVLIYRNEDVDRARCREEFVLFAVADLRWLGLDWEEGPDRPGPVGPYNQSGRREIYLECFEHLKAEGIVYPCVCSRQDVLRAWHAPHPEEEEPRDEEPIYPGTCRPDRPKTGPAGKNARDSRVCWRFRVPDGENIRFEDGGFGPQCFQAGKEFGDFVVWTRADCPSYQLAVVIDDALMGVTEVVRGADLLLSSDGLAAAEVLSLSAGHRRGGGAHGEALRFLEHSTIARKRSHARGSAADVFNVSHSSAKPL